MSPATAPTTKDVVKRIGDTTDKALAYVREPDPALTRLSRGQREQLIADLPPITAGALLGPDALARHLVASAASGRYRDLFALWELFRTDPDACRPVLADRPQALAKAQEAMRTAVRLGLSGHAERVAEDITRAEGLIWQWLREILDEVAPAVGARPAVASALLQREPDADIPLPDEPDERWLAEAAAAAAEGPLAPPIEERLAAGVDRLPATIATLQLAHARYPEKVAVLLGRVDLDSPDVGAMLAWARDHGFADALTGRIREGLEAAAERDRAEALALWRAWRKRGVDLDLPASAREPSLEGLDLTRPETADLIALLAREGTDLRPQEALDALAEENRQRAEKAYEAFVCADLDVTLPKPLEGNPIVKEGTRCPHCLAWTWVRPGHEGRCPRRARAEAEASAAGDRDAAPASAEEPAQAQASPSAADAWVAAAAAQDERAAAAPSTEEDRPDPAPSTEEDRPDPAPPTPDDRPDPAPPTPDDRPEG
ncbi:MAG: hypothetical protein R6T85_04455 [Egibacteraceae bacterium]